MKRLVNYFNPYNRNMNKNDIEIKQGKNVIQDKVNNFIGGKTVIFEWLPLNNNQLSLRIKLSSCEFSASFPLEAVSDCNQRIDRIDVQMELKRLEREICGRK